MHIQTRRRTDKGVMEDTPRITGVYTALRIQGA